MRNDEERAGLADDELVRRGRSGDQGALSVLVRRHHEVAYRVALSILGEAEAAEDAAQNAFLKAFRGLGSFRGDSAFRTWLLTIVSNEAKGLLRKRRRRGEVALEQAPPRAAPDPGPEEMAERSDEVARARRALARLPEKQRMAVTLRVDEGLSFREIGDLIGSSEGAARVNYFHGIRKLREWLA